MRSQGFRFCGFYPLFHYSNIPIVFEFSYYSSLPLFQHTLSFKGVKARQKGGLIYLNTAHHPAAVGATFCHEIGHHLALNLFHHADERPVHFFFDAAYSSHLDDPIELTADVLVSLAAYPKSAARKMFGSEVAAIHEVSARNLDRLLDYLKSGWGIDFEGPRQPGHHLIYLAGMVHYAKLRRALLTEYRI